MFLRRDADPLLSAPRLPQLARIPEAIGLAMTVDADAGASRA